MTAADLAAARALADRVTEAWSKATPGLWVRRDWPYQYDIDSDAWPICAVLHDDDRRPVHDEDGPAECAVGDAHAIASARTDAPALAATTRALADEVERLQDDPLFRQVAVLTEQRDALITAKVRAEGEVVRWKRDHVPFVTLLEGVKSECDAALARVEELERLLGEAGEVLHEFYDATENNFLRMRIDAAIAGGGAVQHPPVDGVDRVTRAICAEYACNKHAFSWMNEIRQRMGLPEFTGAEFVKERRALGEQVEDGEPYPKTDGGSGPTSGGAP